MKIALGVITWDDFDNLTKLLALVKPSIDGEVIVVGQTVNYGESRNQVIKQAEQEGYDWMLMVDSDETMFPKDIDYLRSVMSLQHTAIMLPRYEFGPTPEFYNPTIYPDYQARFFKLNEGYHYRNLVHEILYKGTNSEPVSALKGEIIPSPTHLYHYGRCKDPMSIALKSINYERLVLGIPRLNQVPEGTKFDHDHFFKDVIKFEGEQP